MVWVLVLLLQARVVATPVTKCDRDKYALGHLCCDLCPPGHHVTAHCEDKHATQCSPCQPGTFMAHHNHETQCQSCAECKNTQEVVKNCTLTSDQQCQCKTGTYYCDSENCSENCYPCTRCPGAVRQACSATRDAVCAAEPSPEPGNRTSNHVSTDWDLLVGSFWSTVITTVIVTIVIVTIIIVIFGFIICYCRRRGVQLPQEVVRFFKPKSSEPGSHVRSRESVQPNEDPESGPPAPGVETTPLMEEEGSAWAPGTRPCPGPSDDPGEGGEPTVVSRGSQTAPELALRTVPPAHRPRSQAFFSRLEQLCESVQPSEDPESGPPAPGVETTPLMEEEGSASAPGARPCPGPSSDPGEGVEPTVVSRGSQTAPELALRTVPPAHRPRSRSSFSRLQQEYKQKYFLKDVSCDAINKIYHEFRHKLPEGDWKIFMKFFSTEEKDTEVCDHENPGTLTEPHHKITVCWQKELGRDVFQLMAVLHNMGLHESLQNIINMLIAENIIGSHAETPN